MIEKQGLPSTYSVNDWVKSTKGMIITAYVESEISQEHSFTKGDFEKALGKVSQKRNLPVGEHIREAIQVIKRKKD